jgi:hypothetical protein
MFKKKLPQWSMLPAEVEVTHFYGTFFNLILDAPRTTMDSLSVFKIFVFVKLSTLVSVLNS